MAGKGNPQAHLPKSAGIHTVLEADRWFYFLQLLNHCVPGGKMVRALAAYNGMKVLAGTDNPTPEYLHKAKCLAWSVEMVR